MKSIAYALAYSATTIAVAFAPSTLFSINLAIANGVLLALLVMRNEK